MDLDELKRIPLSDIDIYNRLKGRTNIVLYRDLVRYNKIDDLLVDNSAVILYERQPRNGHWVCIIRYHRNNKPTIEFFDSYGIFPDEEKKFIGKLFLNKSGQQKNKIAQLLYEASYRYVIEYNDYRLQVRRGSIATCGRHVISRILLKDLNIDEYNQFMRSFFGYTPDDIATVISQLNI